MQKRRTKFIFYTDPCQANDCDVNANCIRNDDNITYTCECSEGYTGDGTTCDEVVQGRLSMAFAEPLALILLLRIAACRGSERISFKEQKNNYYDYVPPKIK